jgi:hypothetical protein
MQPSARQVIARERAEHAGERRWLLLEGQVRCVPLPPSSVIGNLSAWLLSKYTEFPRCEESK